MSPNAPALALPRPDLREDAEWLRAEAEQDRRTANAQRFPADGAYYRARAARYERLAEGIEAYERLVREPGAAARKGNAMYCQRCYAELPNHSTSCTRLTELESLSPATP